MSVVQWILAGLASVVVQELQTNGPAIIKAVTDFIQSLVKQLPAEHAATIKTCLSEHTLD